MNANTIDVLDNDHEFALAITAYLKAVDAGQEPKPQEWLARYPELTAELSEFFAGHEQLARLTAPLKVIGTLRVPSAVDGDDCAATTDHGALAQGDTKVNWPQTRSRFLGEYELLEPIAHGGMGIVYKARHKRLNRIVALKLILSGQLARRSDIERFHAEAEAAASLDHPHIVPIYEVGQHAGQHYFTMKLIDGGNLAQHLCRERPPWRSVREGEAPAEPLSPHPKSEISNPKPAARLLSTISRAIHYAHQRGILHRDLKPANILLDFGRGTLDLGQCTPYVTDFGLAKHVGWDQRAQPAPAHHETQTGAILGTASYMAPEQAAGHKCLTTAVDIYSLGAILYEVLTGRPPFREESALETLLHVRERDPALPRTINRQVDRDLETICLKCLEKDPSRRYGSAEALADELDRWLTGEPIQARPISTIERTIRRCRRSPVVSALAAALILVAFTGLLGILSQWQVAVANEQKAIANEQKANVNAAEAQEKAQEANAQRDEAQRQRDEVKALADKLAAKEREMQRTLYTAHVNLARHAWDEGSADQVIDLLEQHRPKAGQADLRGFEWHYLYRLCHSELLTLKGHAQGANSVAFSRDGKLLASGSNDKTIKIWDSESGREILTLTGHAQSVSSVAFSPDGKRIASGTEGYDGRKSLPGEVKVWDSETGRELYSIAGLAHPVMCVAFDPAGQRLASAGGVYTNNLEGAEVKIWDAATGKQLLDLKGHKGTAECAVFSPDGKRLATSDYNTNLKMWDAKTGEELFAGHSDGQLSFSPDGSRLATSWSIIDAQTGNMLRSVGNRVNQNGMKYSPDGKRLANLASSQPVKIYDAESGAELLTLKQRTRVNEVAFSPDGTRLALAHNDGVSIVDALHGPDDRTIGEHNSTVFHVTYSSDGKRLVSASHDKTIKVWDVHTGKNLLTIQEPKSVWTAAISPDGTRIASATGIWDAITGERIHELKGDGQYGSVFSSDGKRLAAGGSLWNSQTGQKLFAIGDGRIPKAFSPDGSLLFAGDRNPVAVYDALTGQELYTLSSIRRSGPGMGVILSPDGRRIASASSDGVVRIMDVKTGNELLSLKGFSGGVQGVAFSPDGKRIAAQSTYRMLKVWDTETGQEMLSLKAGFGHGITFSPDGHQIAAPGDRCVKIWDATPLPEKP